MDEREARLGWALVSEPADTVALSFATEVGVVQSYEWLLSSQKVPPISGKMGKLVSQRAEAWRARLNPSEVAGLLARWGTQGHRFLIPSDPEWPLTGRRLVEQAPLRPLVYRKRGDSPRTRCFCCTCGCPSIYPVRRRSSGSTFTLTVSKRSNYDLWRGIRHRCRST